MATKRKKDGRKNNGRKPLGYVGKLIEAPPQVWEMVGALAETEGTTVANWVRRAMVDRINSQSHGDVQAVAEAITKSINAPLTVEQRARAQRLVSSGAFSATPRKR